MNSIDNFNWDEMTIFYILVKFFNPEIRYETTHNNDYVFTNVFWSIERLQYIELREKIINIVEKNTTLINFDIVVKIYLMTKDKILFQFIKSNNIINWKNVSYVKNDIVKGYVKYSKFKMDQHGYVYVSDKDLITDKCVYPVDYDLLKLQLDLMEIAMNAT